MENIASNIVRQPLGSNICGHCCLSMVSGESLDTSIKLIGHENPASVHELVAAFRELDIRTDTKLRQAFQNTLLPKRAMLKVTYPKNDVTHWHWVAYNDGYIHDSSFRRGGLYLLNEIYSRYLVEVKVSEYLEVFTQKDLSNLS